MAAFHGLLNLAGGWIVNAFLLFLAAAICPCGLEDSTATEPIQAVASGSIASGSGTNAVRTLQFDSDLHDAV